ncbi:phage holin family protein [Paenibacillus cymbidii]|uniref:phage holin family protein n=1 Tax=Paenibacillus cymbidii TaxID=1639034 RepID=UPI0010801C95|nr:phage holin family protein [Paenibacillus cymbidii]
MSIKAIGSTLFTAAIGTSGKETFIGGMIAAAGTAVSAWLGGWDTAIKLLLTLMVADYVSGVLGAWKTKSVNSEVMFWGGIRKGVVMAVILLAVQLDQLVGNSAPIFRTIALYFYIGREGLSVVENFGVLGVKLPAAVTKRLEQLQQKGDEGQ